MKAFGIVSIVNGRPDIGALGYHGFVLCAHIGQNWGCYIFSGTAAQLQAINALPNVYAICAVTEGGQVKWAELDGVIAPAVRTRLNSWLSARGYPNIPAGWTYRQVVIAIYKRINDVFDLAMNDVADSP